MGKKGWCHERRVIDSYEIICPICGALPLQIGNSRYLAGQGSFLIVPPGIEHSGFQPIETTLRFDWFHFILADLHALHDEADIARQAAYTLVLPEYSDELLIDRVSVLTNQLLDIYQRKVPQLYLDSILSCILHEVSVQTKQLAWSQAMQQHELQPVREWIRINALGQITLDQIADYFNYNKSYLSRAYKKKFGINITKEIERFRMDAAKAMLVESDDNIKAVSKAVGYSDARYFMKVFKRSCGMTPTRYRSTFHQRHFNRT
ncbi:helix-turn-helix domain-containing protein [Coriobacterium glomerans]|nr:helix-turn-helix domain-containing protein [Coriobacterium glomerans]